MPRFSLWTMRQEGVKARDRKCERENQYQYLSEDRAKLGHRVLVFVGDYLDAEVKETV